MTLRSATTLWTLGSMGLVLAGATALSITTSVELRHASRLSEAVRGQQIAYEMELSLHRLDLERALYRLTRDPGHLDGSRDAGAGLLGGLADAEAQLGDEQERQLVAQLRAAVAAYVGTGDDAGVPLLAQPEAVHAPVYALTQKLVAEHVLESRRALAEIAAWDRGADLIAALMAGLGLAIATAIFLVVRDGLYRPLVALESTLRRFSEGQRDARMSPGGVKELASIAERFNEMATALELRREAQLEFLAAVAHDIRNPLSALGAATSATAAASTNEQLTRLAAVARRQVGVLDRMVGDLIDAAAIESGRLTTRFEPADVGELARGSVVLLRALTTTHELVVVAPEGSVVAVCDPVRIEQVLNNLIGNAIKYSPRGGRIEVSVRPAGPWVEINVSDEGVGIPAAEQERLFEPFRRGAASAGLAPGLGLGLSVVRRIVLGHGGTLTVKSAVGAGSTFVVRLPRQHDTGRHVVVPTADRDRHALARATASASPVSRG